MIKIRDNIWEQGCKLSCKLIEKKNVFVTNNPFVGVSVFRTWKIYVLSKADILSFGIENTIKYS